MVSLWRQARGLKVWIRARQVQSRFYGHGSTYEAQLIHRVDVGIYKTVGTTRGHSSLAEAEEAARRLAAHRGHEVAEGTAQKMQRLDRYGDD